MLKMTQKDLASHIGVTFQQLQKYESGLSNVSINMLLKLCDTLNVGVNYFVTTNEYADLHDYRDKNYTTYQEQTEEMQQELIGRFNSIDDQTLKDSILLMLKAIVDAQKK
jgi:transcriptional regulator with XRE-family HTH domain